MEKVALVACADYVQQNVDRAVTEAINLIGGIEKYVSRGQNVVLKANLLMKATPEKCATTHPSIVEAVGKLVKQAGANVTIADSAGGPYNSGYIGMIYKAGGMTDIAEKNGFKLNDNYKSYEASYPQGKISKKFYVLDALESADVIINLTKLKTHAFTGYTNAVKNMFGAIPGLTKVEMHGQFRTLEVFNEFLYDIQGYFKPKLVLHVTDAVMGMEGHGPSNGSPRKIGAVIAGVNPVAVDTVGLRLMNSNPIKSPTIQTGVARGWLKNADDVEVVGARVEDLAVKDFQTVVPDINKPLVNFVPKFLQGPLHRLMTRRPAISKRKCRGCRKCFEHCPVQAITMVKVKKGEPEKAVIDYSKCIRCFCCQELCPFGVVKVKSGMFYKVVHIGHGKRVNKKQDAAESKTCPSCAMKQAEEHTVSAPVAEKVAKNIDSVNDDKTE